MSKRKTMAEKLMDDFNNGLINEGLGESLKLVNNINSDDINLDDINLEIEKNTKQKKSTSFPRTAAKQPADNRRTTGVHLTANKQTANKQQSSNRQPTDVQQTTNKQTTDKQRTNDKQLNLNPIDRNDNVWSISDYQAIILGYYIKQERRIVKRNELKNETGIISNSTITDSIRTLTIKGFITQPERFKNRGATYNTFNDICSRFLKERWPEIVAKYGNPPDVRNFKNEKNTGVDLTDIQRTTDRHPTDKQQNTTKQHSSYNSSSSSLNNTNLLSKISSEYDHNPELKYFKHGHPERPDFKIIPKQILKWMNEFPTIGFQEIIESLCHCNHFLLKTSFKDIRGDDIKDISNWFYSRIKKHDYYKPEKDYKSYEQLQVEKQAEIARLKHQTAENLRKIRKDKEDAEKELLLERVLADQESLIHKKCFEIADDWTKNRFKNIKMRRGDKYRKLISKSIDKLFDEGDENLALFLENESNPSPAELPEKTSDEIEKNDDYFEETIIFAKNLKKEGNSLKEILKITNQTLKVKKLKPINQKILKEWGIV